MHRAKLMKENTSQRTTCTMKGRWISKVLKVMLWGTRSRPSSFPGLVCFKLEARQTIYAECDEQATRCNISFPHMTASPSLGTTWRCFRSQQLAMRVKTSCTKITTRLTTSKSVAA